MNRISYSILLWLACPVVILYFLWRGIKSPDYRGRLKERFGLGLPRPHQPILVHCASMGETLAAVPLIKKLQQANPETSFVITSSSPTGSAQVKTHFGDSVEHCYLPIDLSLWLRPWLKAMRPKAVVLMETELWPNLIHQSHKLNIPVVVANARLSERSARGYGKVHKLVTPMLEKLSAVAVQNSTDGARLVSLGVNPSILTDCGSLKFDIQIDDEKRQQALSARQNLLLGRQNWVAGSVHPGEMEMALAAHKRLLDTDANWLLVMVPRHPEQFESAFNLAQQAGFNVQRRSDIEQIDEDTQVLIGNTMGELLTFYGASELCFVGGSLIERGGHNPLEPVAFDKPVLMGPNYFNFQEIATGLKAKKILIEVADQQQLAEQLIACDDQARSEIAKRTQGFMAQNGGATQRQFEVIQQQLS
ncbi:lipid IV(A) 3-deoxy-D-manno-octulosonic acid transferase [Ferrimonas aestuarii]|uniref:3-deoxy-D-manno-octulosonic acid transferase n=1 Tax=Ferrimonas aestuarii TaxID=2569539 RepID=A0A4U1BQ51_9GAMM|nr:lipid IV(A) 3-deoxy-D-manno-octulosonic acid transferase [Ferrimonas aestuarii]TKB56274.1 3-deoxy-D-manno-octulosonic acid transferase [Ferrimonas aestuarii]